MKYLFPYHKVKQNSQIVLYGCGECGKDFWLQIHLSRYCDIVAWVDRSFEGFEVNKPFDYVDKISDYTYDYIVIAINDKKISDEVVEFLLSIGIDKSKMIWSNTYSICSKLFPDDKVRFLRDFDYYISVMDDAIFSENIFAGGRYYQGLKKIGFKGSRDNEERIAVYRIPEMLNREMLALDMGCNYGFLDILLAPYVSKITGVDVEPAFISMAKKTADYLDIDNAVFVCDDTYRMLNNCQQKYDVIFNLGVYGYILSNGVSEEEFVETITSHINDKGLFFFESHPLTTIERRESFDRICGLIKEEMTIKYEINYESIGERLLRVFEMTN